MKNKLSIRKLSLDDEEAFVRAYQEFKGSADFVFVSHYREGMAFGDLISILDDQEKGLNLPERFVPSTFLFAFVGMKMVGRVMIRHRLNDFLRTIGGHIGYGVVPSERGQGYASEMLEHALKYAKTLGLSEVLITCDEGNLPSQKIIENAGGIFKSFSNQDNDLPRKKLFMISLG